MSTIDLGTLVGDDDELDDSGMKGQESDLDLSHLPKDVLFELTSIFEITPKG